MDKQIEELMKDMCTDYPCNRICDQYCGMYDYAERAINAGYRKIPENAVVLTKEEYDGKVIVVEMSGGHKLKLSVGKFYEMSKILEEYTRKETAEKFAEMANKRIAQRQGERDCYETFAIDDKARYDGDIVSLALFEICKEITG